MSGKIKYILIIFLIPFLSFSQKPSSIINPDSVNLVLLDSLIKVKIDSVRLLHNKKVLTESDTLLAAALDQANYVKKKKELTHYQASNKKKYSVSDRTAFYGWKSSFIGENLVYTTLTIKIKAGKKWTYTIGSYEATAKYMVTLWVKSKGHYENIVTSEYTRTGVATAYDDKKQILYACQVFSE